MSLMILLSAILVAGCGDQAGSQPPASLRTLPSTPVTTTTLRNLPTFTATTRATLPAVTPLSFTGSIGQEGSCLQITSPVIGYRGTGGSYLDRFTFDLEKVPDADPVDMETVQVTLTRYSEITGLRFEITGRSHANSDSVLEDGEIFAIVVPVMPNYWLYRNEQFELRVLTPGSAPIVVQSRVPAVVEEEQILAEP
ncbi:MAG: hypothetical protein LUQ64_00810 [Methanomicrobiales archaeon]|nr:hypothetical protein [Methanomicrobiales archaeon]